MLLSSVSVQSLRMETGLETPVPETSGLGNPDVTVTGSEGTGEMEPGATGAPKAKPAAPKNPAPTTPAKDGALPGKATAAPPKAAVPKQVAGLAKAASKAATPP